MKCHLRREIQLWKNRGGDQMELPIRESMSQKQKLQFLQPRGSEAKKVILSQLITYGNLQTHSSSLSSTLSSSPSWSLYICNQAKRLTYPLSVPILRFCSSLSPLWIFFYISLLLLFLFSIFPPFPLWFLFLSLVWLQKGVHDYHWTNVIHFI